MKTKIFLQNDNYIAGMTMKDIKAPEFNNMALHVCKNPEAVLQNRQKLSALVGCSLQDFVCANQTHSANFHRVVANDKGRGSKQQDTAIANTDALYTFEPGIMLVGFTADCVPVIFHDETNGLIGVIHSGWQGTVKEITIKLFAHLHQNEGCNMTNIKVQIGAALSQEKFEVDEDVFLRFKSLGYAEEFMYYNEQTGKYHIDNQLVVKRQCELSGIPSEQIVLDRTCTFKSPDGFSYREDKQCGRHAAFIIREK